MTADGLLIRQTKFHKSRQPVHETTEKRLSSISLIASVLPVSIRTSLSHAAMASSHARWSIKPFVRCSKPPGFLMRRADLGRA